MLHKTACFLVFLIFLSCNTARHGANAPRKQRHLTARIAAAMESSAVFAQSFTGFNLQDAESGAVLYSTNADHYFTPASNIKILTLAACLSVLGDSLKGLEYSTQGRHIWFRGTGDPTFLHAQFKAWQPAYTFLKNRPDSMLLHYAERPLAGKRFGDGWCWDDYGYAYQTERSTMPVYGNCFQVNYDPISQSNKTTPAYFNAFNDEAVDTRRDEFGNNWYISPAKRPEQEQIPFRTSTALLTNLLSDTLRKTVQAGPETIQPTNWQTIYSCPADTVYKWMMHKSDNHSAEQLLIMAALQQAGVAHQDSMIQRAVADIFPATTTPPRWEDGSGLSRYNLATPRYFCQVLQQLYRNTNRQRLFGFFPAGGVQGTIQNWLGSPSGEPYIFAKTGSMGGVLCLSGYLVTKSGKTLIFSFMHNNFKGTNQPWKTEMQRILQLIYEDF